MKRISVLLASSVLACVGATASASQCEQAWGALEGGGTSGGVAAPAVLALTGSVSLADLPPQLYLGGNFTHAGGTLVERIARWDGSSYHSLDGGVSSPFADTRVRTMMLWPGGGPLGEDVLVVGGNFTQAGSIPAERIAQWDGASWAALGPGLNWQGFFSQVTALEVFQGDLYVGGYFTHAGTLPVDYIARWDGSRWHAVGPPGAAGMDEPVHGLVVHDDGNGPALHAAGNFTTAGGVAVSYIARWNGTAWSDVGGGMNASVNCLRVWQPPGEARSLYAGGLFTSAGGVAANRVARWDGAGWSPLGSGLGGPFFPTAEAFIVFDDLTGEGPLLYVGGQFDLAGGLPAKNLARWNGAQWSDVGAGVGVGSTSSAAYAMAVHDQDLFVGGSFMNAGSTANLAANIARWNGCPAPPGVDYCFGDGSGSACPCGNVGGAGHGCANSSGMGAVLAGSGTSGVAADDLVLMASSLLPGRPALLFFGDDVVGSGDGVPFGDGLRCVGGAVLRLGVETPDPGGQAAWGPGLGSTGRWSAGDTRYFQVWYRDATNSPCGTQLNLSNGVEVTFTH